MIANNLTNDIFKNLYKYLEQIIIRGLVGIRRSKIYKIYIK